MEEIHDDRSNKSASVSVESRLEKEKFMELVRKDNQAETQKEIDDLQNSIIKNETKLTSLSDNSLNQKIKENIKDQKVK